MKSITYNLLLEESLDMPIVFRSVCTRYDQESIRWPESYTDFYVLQFIVDGRGIFRCKGREYVLEAGCAFFVKKGVAFEYLNTGELESAFLSTVGTVPERFALSCKDDEYLFYNKVNLKKYLGLLEDIEREYYMTSKKSRLSSMAYEILAEFFSEGSGTVATVNEQVLRYIKRNFTKKLTLQDISNDVGISVSKLCHDFKRAYGCSVFTKIKNLRLDYARELLLSNHNLKIKEAAISCGFDDLSYFCNAYKKRFGKNARER